MAAVTPSSAARDTLARRIQTWSLAAVLGGLLPGAAVAGAQGPSGPVQPTALRVQLDPNPDPTTAGRGPAHPLPELEAFHFPVFANIEWSESYYAAGAGKEVADDCRYTGGGDMTGFEFMYYGGAASGETSATVRFYQYTPPGGLLATIPVAGLDRTPGYLRSKHVVVDPPVSLPDSFWMSVEFADGVTGLCTGTLDPEYGTTLDQFWLEGQGVVSFTGDTPSNFMILVFKEAERPEDFSLSDQTVEAFGAMAGLGSHTAFVDYDQDGWDDISFRTNDVYHNNGDGTFTEVALPGLSEVSLYNVAWADFDNDGDLDAMTSVGGPGLARPFRNDGGTFTEIHDMTSAVDPKDDMVCLGWGDFNADGLLDCYSTNLGNIFDSGGTGKPDRLWRNNGDDSFTNVTGTAIPAYNFAGRGVAWADYDNDGDSDVYISDYWQYPNCLFRNNGGESMSSVSWAMGVAGNHHSAGSCWGDYDNDGDMDLVAPSIHGYPWLYRNDGDGFTEVSTAAGIHLYGEWAAGHFVDLNNDGWLDLYAHKWYQGQMARFFLSNGPSYPGGPVTFTDVTFDIGGWRIDSGNAKCGSWADYDNDGDLDLLTQWQPYADGNYTRLMRNELNNGNHWLHVRLVGTTTNATGIGARVSVTTGDLTQMRDISGQSETGVGHSHRAHFGLGAATAVDTLAVRWPGGEETVLTGVAADQIITITEGEQPALTAARSCRDHGAAGPFCLDVMPGANVEPRLGGVARLEFDCAFGVTGFAAAADCDYAAYTGTVTPYADGGSTIAVEFDPPLPADDCCTISLTGDLEAGYSIATLEGDVDRNLIVNSIDASAIKPRFGQATDEANFIYDVGCDGIVSSLDYSAIKPRFGHQLPGCP